MCEKRRENECTSTFARYAIWGSAIEDHPPKERAVGDVLLGPGCPQSSAPAALLPAHPRHVEHLAPPVLALLQPAVSSCTHTGDEVGKKNVLSQVGTSEAADPDALDTHAVSLIRDTPSLPFTLPALRCLIFFFSSLPDSEHLSIPCVADRPLKVIHNIEEVVVFLRIFGGRLHGLYL